MKILMLLENAFPPDDRVEKEAISLIAAGHEVHIASVRHKNEIKQEEVYKGIYVHRKKTSRLMLKKFSAAMLVLPVYFYFWESYVRDLQLEYSFDAVHVHDLPLSRIGYSLKKKHGLKLICDQHEYYSNWIVKTAHYNTFIGKIIRAFSNWVAYEKRYLSFADLVITVEEPLRNNYIGERGILPRNIICLPNTPLGSVFNRENVSDEILNKYKDDFVMVYPGNMDILRGIDLIISVLPGIAELIPNIKLLLIGKSNGGYDPMRTAKRYGVEKYVEIISWQPIDMLPSYIAASNIGVFTPPVNRDEINLTIATKIYQYIAMGKPIVVSSAKLMKDFVEGNNIGLAMTENTPAEFLSIISKLYKEPGLLRSMMENGINLANKYTWESSSKVLVSRYSQFDKG